MRPDIRASAFNLMLLSHLQALHHCRGSHGCWYGPSKRCSLCLVHSRDIKLDHSSRIAAAGGVGSSNAAGAGRGVVDHLGYNSEGLSRGQTQLCCCAAGEREGRCALAVGPTQLQLGSDQEAPIGGYSWGRGRHPCGGCRGWSW